jgi:hypothetical protein
MACQKKYCLLIPPISGRTRVPPDGYVPVAGLAGIAFLAVRITGSRKLRAWEGNIDRLPTLPAIMPPSPGLSPRRRTTEERGIGYMEELA